MQHTPLRKRALAGVAAVRRRDKALAALAVTAAAMAVAAVAPLERSMGTSAERAAVAPVLVPPGIATSPADPRYSLEVTGTGGQPARWNPCDPITYAVLDKGAPPGWQADVADVVARARAATGLRFVDEGTFPTGSRGGVAVGTGIVISWVSSFAPGSSGGEVGLTTYSYINDSRFAPQMTAARIQLLSSLSAGWRGSGAEEPVLLHEMGHALGLGHVPGEPEVMNPIDHGFSAYQPGDLSGLRRLGSGGGCSGFYK